ncbi:TRAP transporter small permease [Moorella sulfitireducens]|uniref:TRAP transporter small permease n=1 Tax=Neomoorella sulfitireducens TaxID=2972948 RepID=UPI0021ABEE5B|nr:TRAP transporter small permease [Moorella sulfitireducens]
MKQVMSTVSRWAGTVSSLFIFIMMLLTVADVGGRYFLNRPVNGAIELVEFMLIIIVFPSLAWCVMEDKHIAVDLLMARLSGRLQAVVGVITLLLTLGTYAVITWATIRETLEVNTRTGLLRIPHAPFYWVMSLGMVLFCLAVVVQLISNAGKVMKK